MISPSSRILKPFPPRQKEIEQLMWKNDKYLHLRSSEEYNKLFRYEEIQWFCHTHGLYQVPTIELVDFLKKEITDTAIEIGAGLGQIGCHLDIRMTDSKLQARPEMVKHYTAMGAPVINYGDHVEKIGAITAVKKYFPRIVLACWVTEKNKWNTGGVNEVDMIPLIRKYILVGNRGSHADKTIFRMYKTTEIELSGLLSRAANPQDNRIWIVER